MTRSANPELRFNAAMRSRRNEMLRARNDGESTVQNAADEGADGSGRSSCKAVVSWTRIPEIWAALERRFA
jgi:hypothetical protein